MPAQRPEESEKFGEADYAAPTMGIAYARMRMDADASLLEKRSSAAAISVSVPGGKRLARRGRKRQKPMFAFVSLLIMVVLCIMAGVVYLAFPLVVSASVNIGPQVHMLQQVYTITAQPSQSGIDVATTSIPALEKVDSITGSLTEQTTGQQCDRFFFFMCQQAVAPVSQLRQSLISRLSAQMDSQLQAIHAAEIGSKQFTDLSESSTPDNGRGSRTITVTLTEQGSVEYINNADAQQLARLLLAQELGPNTSLVNSTIQISQPVVEEVTDQGMVTLRVAAAGVEEYHYPPTQLQTILNHIKGKTLADARVYLRQQPGVDANSVSISIHAAFGDSSTLPYSTSQIKIISINPTVLPSASLPVLSTPTTTLGSLTPNL